MYINHDCARFPVFKVLNAIGFKSTAIDNHTFVVEKDTKSYKFVFSKNSEWGNVFSLDIYDNFGNILNDYTTCRFISNEFIINDEKFNSLYNIFWKKIKVNYDKLILYI